MASNEEKDKERKGGGIPLLAARGSSGGRLTLGAHFERFWHNLLTAPNATMARGLFGAALAVSAAWTASAIAYRLDPDRPAEARVSAAASRGPLFRTEDGRSALMPMLDGLRMIMGVHAPASDAEGGAPAAGSSIDALSPAAPPEPGGTPSEEPGQEGEGGEEKAPSGGTPSLGGLSSAGGGSAGSSSASGAPPVGPSGASAGSAASPAKGGTPGDYRSTALIRSGKIAASNPARGRGAMKQLKFANNLSKQAQRSPGMESGYTAAEAAFSGQAPKAGMPASPDGGVQQDGPGPKPQPMSTPISSKSCPAGYFINGDVCSPMTGESGNKTPYQDELDAARRYLIFAAILAAVGIALLALTSSPILHILGGLLLGFALIMVVAAAVFGDDIINKFGQMTQGLGVKSAGSAAMQGQAPK
ncbi:MAG TPA: hypothetical protein DCM05_07890 [Elusimicrobia bacterium]|nr:hypothetical protein [Elusimicrobiota bacterium]